MHKYTRSDPSRKINSNPQDMHMDSFETNLSSIICTATTFTVNPERHPEHLLTVLQVFQPPPRGLVHLLLQ